MKTKFEDVPLHLLGDAVIAAYAKAGFQVVISLSVADGGTGKVNGTSNLDERAEVDLLRWVIDQRAVGVFDEDRPEGSTLQ
jgi:hypothetical protein